MKFIKFLTRKYTLLEHWLITESLKKENTSIPEIYYKNALDVSKKGLVDVYVTLKDWKRNKQWVIKQVKDSNFLGKILKKGLLETKKFSDLPSDLLKKIPKLKDKKIISELLKLKKKIFTYSGYVDFTIYLDDLNIYLNQENIKRFTKFHDYRKRILIKYFKFLEKVCRKIAKKKKVKSGNLNYLSFSEIINLLKGKLTPKETDDLQRKRKRYYIAKRTDGKEIIISDGFNKEFKKIKKDVLKEKSIDKIKGTAINQGIVRGKVQIIKQTTPLKKISPGKIIVTQMTSPVLTPMLKKALAIITDEGGLLCHAASIAREFGIIALIGTKIATKVLKDGDRIEVDATKGIVKKLK